MMRRQDLKKIPLYKWVVVFGVLSSIISVIISNALISGKRQTITSFEMSYDTQSMLIDQTWERLKGAESFRQVFITAAFGHKVNAKALSVLLSGAPLISEHDKQKLLHLIKAGDETGVISFFAQQKQDLNDRINNAYDDSLRIAENITNLQRQVDDLSNLALMLQAMAIICVLAKDLRG
jgi:hypothetical protein